MTNSKQNATSTVVANINHENFLIFEDDYILVKPVCEFFKLSVQNQHRKLKKDPILGKLWIKKSTDLGKIDKNGSILLSKKGFIRWVQLINVNIIEESLKDKFIQFQELIFDYLYGTAHTEQQAQIDYARLKRLRSLYAKIGREIQRVEKSFSGYLENKFVQYKINFEKQKEIVNDN